jgi:hypothetical protein
MKKTRHYYPGLTAIAAGLVLVALLTASAARAVRPSSAVPVDLSSELRSLDSYTNDLASFDKTFRLASKKNSLTRNEVDGLQRNADDLKRRLSGLQSALGQIINKLKAANEWDKLDETALAQITDARVRSQLSQVGLKRLLEQAAAGDAVDGNEITAPVEALRRKIASSSYDFDPYGRGESTTWRPVQASYSAEPVFAQSVRCRLSCIRAGIYGFVQHSPIQAAPKGSTGNDINNRVNCFCADISCDAI